ncbi:MAG TPA: D-alanyl-D-alanine carboxypeptidase, partial [Chitinophagaceae bacterium]|nr:D-alanyl-D-alanine carboxypeptidase [Chitinophagaceae bacterium]
KYLYNYQGEKYFVPASNTKIPTTYVAMKYLGDSILGLEVLEYNDRLVLLPAGDPTFLHPDFKRQPVFEYFKSLAAVDRQVWFASGRWQDERWGAGWSWNDYASDYMAERSAFPIYGNVITTAGRAGAINILPSYFKQRLTHYSTQNGFLNRVERDQYQNNFRVYANGSTARQIQTPFVTSDTLGYLLLMDTLKLSKQFVAPGNAPAVSMGAQPVVRRIYSQRTDSLLKPLMHRSDNFFAEQTLLMASYRLMGVMNDARLIDSVLKTDFKDLPQRPRWADGSGLSRYNLFTPQDFVSILNKMRTEFGMDRIKEIFPTGNEGTLTNYYKADSSFLYAKTGTLSGVVALSGFLYTKKNKLLLFSVLVNNHQAS